MIKRTLMGKPATSHVETLANSSIISQKQHYLAIRVSTTTTPQPSTTTSKPIGSQIYVGNVEPKHKPSNYHRNVNLSKCARNT